jgi:hypothetical protein
MHPVTNMAAYDQVLPCPLPPVQTRRPGMDQLWINRGTYVALVPGTRRIYRVSRMPLCARARADMWVWHGSVIARLVSPMRSHSRQSAVEKTLRRLSSLINPAHRSHWFCCYEIDGTALSSRLRVFFYFLALTHFYQ